MKKKQRWITILCTMILLLCMLSPVSVSAASSSAVPAKVTITRISASPSRKVTLSWKKTARATGYRIYYKQYGSRSWKYIASTTGTSYTHTSTSKYPLSGGKNTPMLFVDIISIPASWDLMIKEEELSPYRCGSAR